MKLSTVFIDRDGTIGGNGSVIYPTEFEKQLVEYGFDDIYICPHNDSYNCNCRKPNPGMLIEAANKYKLNLSEAVVIGDSWRDMLAAHKVNAKKILVKTGEGNKNLERLKKDFSEVKLDYIAENLLEAVKWIIDNY